jgi:hypothetical protein
MCIYVKFAITGTPKKIWLCNSYLCYFTACVVVHLFKIGNFDGPILRYDSELYTFITYNNLYNLIAHPKQQPISTVGPVCFLQRKM